jgi:hypothetical protein
MIPALGEEPEGVWAELQALDPPWVETARVERDGDGCVVGAVLVELDTELGQAWILGPWMAANGETWVRFAGLLVEAALAQVPATFTGRTLSGHRDNIRLAELAAPATAGAEAGDNPRSTRWASAPPAHSARCALRWAVRVSVRRGDGGRTGRRQ